MGNSDLLFIFTLAGNWKWKTIVKGQDYQHSSEALILATQRLVKEWSFHNEEAYRESTLPESDRSGRIVMDFSPENVQIEEL